MMGRSVAASWLRALVITLGLVPSADMAVTPQLHDVQTRSLTAIDGTEFEMTTGVVRVPEQRTAGVASSKRTIDLAVVSVRRAGTPATPSAHVILAGGPGDSGVEQVLGLARQGGRVFAELVSGDVVGIDQRGTGRSVPNLSSPAL